MDALRSDEFEDALGDNLCALTRTADVQPEVASPMLCCLGESHGTHVFALDWPKLPGTGGLLLRAPGGHDLLLDPGWGTVAAAKRQGVSLARVGTVLLSHSHLDHIGDLHALLVTLSVIGRRPKVLGNVTTIEGGPDHPTALPTYFRDLCEEAITAEPGRELRSGPFGITPFRTGHREGPNAVGLALGYVVDLPGTFDRSVGLVTDGPMTNIGPEAVEKLRSCTTISVNLGTMSANPESPAHSRVFDNALCLHGLGPFLGRIVGTESRLTTLVLTHLGAELFEVKSDAMRRFLEARGVALPVDLLARAAQDAARVAVDRDLRVVVMREGTSVDV